MEYEVKFKKEDGDIIEWRVRADNEAEAHSRVQSRIQQLEQTNQFIESYNIVGE